MVEMTAKVYIYDHTKYLRKSARRRTFFGQSIRATTFFVALLVLFLFLPIAYLFYSVTGFLPQFLQAIIVMIPIVVPIMAVVTLLESRNEGDTFLSFLKKKWKFKTSTNYKKEDGSKFMYAIGMAPKQRIVRGQTLFMPSLVEIPRHISNLSGYVEGEPVDESKTVNTGIVISRRD